MSVLKILTDLSAIRQNARLKSNFGDIVYNADFESLLKGVKSSDRSNNTSYTERYQKQILCSFANKVVCINDKFSKPVVL